MERRRSVKWVLLVACTLLPLLASQVRAQSDHHLRWRTIRTDHFRIHYHEPLGMWARQLAAEVEAVHARIAGALGLRLRQPVQLVLADENDAANGFASAVPYNAIHLRVSSPDDMAPLADYDDWPTTLLTHEHTHVLHFEQASGLPRFLQYLFGRFYTPQSFLPGWIIEGIAVVEESAHTSGGRIRSAMFDMYLRTDALEDRLLGLDWIGFDGEPWPHGNLRYLYGAAFIEFVKQRHGQAALGRFIGEYGRRLVPYGLNRALQRATGETFVELYRAFVAQQRTRAAQVAGAVSTAGRVEGVRLTHHGELTRCPRFLSATELAYAVSDGRHVPELRRLRLDADARSERIVRVGNVGQVATVPGGERVVYSAVDYQRGVYAFNELFAIDADGTDGVKLTHGVRAREPDVAPDGRRIAFVTQSAGTSHLEIAELADIEHSRKIVVRSRRLEQVFTPRWSPDGRRIAYSAFARGGYRDIWVLEVDSGLRTRLTYDRAIDRGPVFSRDGRKLYFSSDRGGIANLYAYDFGSGELSQLTNVVGGAFQPDLSPDGRTLVYVGYTSRGFDLYALDLARTSDAARARGVPLASAPPAGEPARPEMRALPEPAPLVSTSYQPLRTLWPRSYELATEDTGTDTRVMLSTRGEDAVGLHRWSLRAISLLERRDRALELGYSFRQARFPVLAYGSLRDSERTDLVVSRRRRPWRARSGSFGMGSTFAFPRPLHTIRLRVDFVGRFLQKVQPFRVPLDPNYPPPRVPPLGFDTEAFWTASYASAQRQPFDISASWGQVATVSLTQSEPYLGSRQRAYGLSYRFEQFVRAGPREGVLALAYTGAYHTPIELGGYPSQLVPLRDALLGVQGAPADYARLRGFATRRGTELQVLQLEYRVLIARINRGVDTLPLFARRLHAAVFADAGDAWTGAFSFERVGVGVGGELRLDWASDYGSDYTLRAGLARGLTLGGQLQWYTTLATPF